MVVSQPDPSLRRPATGDGSLEPYHPGGDLLATASAHLSVPLRAPGERTDATLHVGPHSRPRPVDVRVGVEDAQGVGLPSRFPSADPQQHHPARGFPRVDDVRGRQPRAHRVAVKQPALPSHPDPVERPPLLRPPDRADQALLVDVDLLATRADLHRA